MSSPSILLYFWYQICFRSQPCTSAASTFRIVPFHSPPSNPCLQRPPRSNQTLRTSVLMSATSPPLSSKSRWEAASKSIQKHLSIKVRGEADIGSLTASVHRSSEHKSLCSLLMFQYSRILTDVAARQPWGEVRRWCGWWSGSPPSPSPSSSPLPSLLRFPSRV